MFEEQKFENKILFRSFIYTEEGGICSISNLSFFLIINSKQNCLHCFYFHLFLLKILIEKRLDSLYFINNEEKNESKLYVTIYI